MKIKNVIEILESEIPLIYAEDFDNTGLLVGNKEADLTGILITHDTLESVVDEAISKELQGLREEIRMEAKDYIKDVIESVIREEIERFLLELKIADIIREETRKTVERKISELLK